MNLLNPKYIALILIFSLNLCSKEHSHTKEIWYCPMHTDYTSDHPGKCPICNMDLVLKKEENKQKVSGDAKNDEGKDESKSLVLSADKEALIGIKTSKAEFRNLVKRILSSGTVAYDPDLYAAVLEYREAIRNSKISDDDTISSNALIQSAKVRLKQLGLSDSMILEWSKEDKDISELISGGKSGKALIYSQVYESDISLVKVGQEVEVKSSSFPGKIFRGKVRGIDSIVDSKNRTLRIRSQVKDPENLLKPQMYAEVEILSVLGKLLSIPKSAVLDTGKKQIVYVKISESRFTPKIINIGRETDDYYEVQQGLKENDEIVTGANFLLDSEAKLKLGDINETGHKH